MSPLHPEFAFKRGPNATITTHWLGQERSPVVVIDDVLANPDEMVRYAIGVPLEQVTENLYPGVRGALPQSFAIGLIQALDPVIRSPMGLEGLRVRTAEGYLSLVTREPEELVADQMVPHFDTTMPHQIAIVLYLCAPKFGGTSFFRQRRSGFERITDNRHDEWARCREEERASPAPKPSYIQGNSNDYDLIGSAQHKYNRLIAYHSNLMHSGIIRPDITHPADAETGRLTVTMFLHYHPQ